MHLSVSINDIHYQETLILSDVNFQVQAGEIVAVFGRNGSGKSTLLRSIVGIHTEWTGSIKLNDIVLKEPQPHQLRSMGITYLPQVKSVFERLSIRDNFRVSMYGDYSNSGMTFTTLGKHFASRMDQNASVLSGGERQALALSMIFSTEPKFVLLDEPCASLSPASSAEILSLVKSKVLHDQMSALIVEQNVQDLLSIADKVLIIADGGITYFGDVTSLQEGHYGRLFD